MEVSRAGSLNFGAKVKSWFCCTNWWSGMKRSLLEILDQPLDT